MDTGGKRPLQRLQVLPGGRDPAARIGPVLVVAGGKNDTPPFPVDAVVLEEDRFLVLSAEPVFVEPLEDPMRLMTRLIETRPETPGHVLVRGRGPYRMLAIVHDVDQEPSWREEWVAEALERVLRKAQSLGIEALSLEMLGCMHGRLAPRRFSALFREAVRCAGPGSLKRVWLRVPRKVTPSAVAGLLREGS